MTSPQIQPVLKAAEQLDLAACVHATNGSRIWFECLANATGTGSGFSSFKLSGIAEFHELIGSGLPARYPALRWGFLELSSQWIPYVLNDLMLRFRTKKQTLEIGDLLERNNIYVACQATDDLPYILNYVSSENLVVGSDYGHHDTSSELDVMAKLADRPDLAKSDLRNICEVAPAVLYGLAS